MKKDEYTNRHQAIKMRLADQTVEQICRKLQWLVSTARCWFAYILESRIVGTFINIAF
jgi:hypothetical protein